MKNKLKIILIVLYMHVNNVMLALIYDVYSVCNSVLYNIQLRYYAYNLHTELI